jgi:hypothetical protein
MDRRLFIVELEALDGDDTCIRLEADGEVVSRLWCIVRVGSEGAGIVDNGYRALAEAQQAWPEAIAPKPPALTREAGDQGYTIEGEPSIE